MKTLALAIALALPMAASATTITVGLDVSGSNQLITHKHFAQSAATFVSDKVSALEHRDTARLQTIGARDNALNQLMIETEVSRRARPSSIARAFAGQIQSLPDQPDLAQSSTNLIAWLELSGGFDCENGGQIILLTDGLESSELASPSALLNGEQGLPVADVDLSGCTLTLYGLGAGFQASQVKHLRNAWQVWAKQAGASLKTVIR